MEKMENGQYIKTPYKKNLIKSIIDVALLKEEAFYNKDLTIAQYEELVKKLADAIIVMDERVTSFIRTIPHYNKDSEKIECWTNVLKYAFDYKFEDGSLPPVLDRKILEELYDDEYLF